MRFLFALRHSLSTFRQAFNQALTGICRWGLAEQDASGIVIGATRAEADEEGRRRLISKYLDILFAGFEALLPDLRGDKRLPPSLSCPDDASHG